MRLRSLALSDDDALRRFPSRGAHTNDIVSHVTNFGDVERTNNYFGGVERTNNYFGGVRGATKVTTRFGYSGRGGKEAYCILHVNKTCEA